MENQVEADSAPVVGRTHSPKAAGRISCRMILYAVWAILSRSVTSFRITMFYEPWTCGTHQSRSLTPWRSVPDNPPESVEYISILPLKRRSPRQPVSACPSDSCSARPSTSPSRYRPRLPIRQPLQISFIPSLRPRLPIRFCPNNHQTSSGTSYGIPSKNCFRNSFRSSESPLGSLSEIPPETTFEMPLGILSEILLEVL